MKGQENKIPPFNFTLRPSVTSTTERPAVTILNETLNPAIDSCFGRILTQVSETMKKNVEGWRYCYWTMKDAIMVEFELIYRNRWVLLSFGFYKE